MSLILGILDSGGAAAGAAGSYESIATVNVGSGGSATVEFTSIPATYTHLQIRAIGRTTRAETNDALNMRFNSDTGSNYSWHRLDGQGDTGSATASSATSQTTIIVDRFSAATAGNASMFGAFVLDILDYANTNKYKTTRNLGGYDLNGSGLITFASGLWQSTSAITSITLVSRNAGNLSQYSSFALYGIKGS
jgi:hypothetical protein